MFNDSASTLKDLIVEVECWGEKYKVRIKVQRYANGNAKALQLYSVEDGAPFATLTCNVPGTSLGLGEILVKTWSENKWACQLLERYPDVFKDTDKRIPTGYVEAEVWTFDEARAKEAGYLS
jgi:hypothetical protein